LESNRNGKRKSKIRIYCKDIFRLILGMYTRKSKAKNSIMFSKNWGFYIMIFEDEASFSNKEQKPKLLEKFLSISTTLFYEFYQLFSLRLLLLAKAYC